MYGLTRIENEQIPQISSKGVYCLPNAIGNWSKLSDGWWTVLEFDEKDLILLDRWKIWKKFSKKKRLIPDIYNKKYKIKKCKIVFSQTMEGATPEKMLSFFDDSKFDSYTAYAWALNIGSKNKMLPKITKSQTAYFWAKNIGNRDKMVNKITESEWALYWASQFGNKNIMIDRITESEWAYKWGLKFSEDRDKMIDKITDPYWATYWVGYIGNADIMLKKFPEIKAAIYVFKKTGRVSSSPKEFIA